MNLSDKRLQVVVIGGGPIGLACALEAKQMNLSYVIIEKGAIVNSLYHYPEGMTFFSSSEKLEIGDVPFISQNARPFKSESLEYYRRIVSANDLKIHLFEKVDEVIENQDGTFFVYTSKRKYHTENVVIATGFYDTPKLLNIPGEELPKVAHYYRDPHFYAQQRVIIVGASNSAVDAALEIARKGGHVTMIIRGNKISDRVKYWVRPNIINRIEEGTIKACYQSTLKSINDDSVTIDQNGEEIEIKNDYVLALTGYQPDFEFFRKIGIRLDDERLKPIYNPDTMEATDLPGIYLAGVVCGGLDTHQWFIENSRIHAQIIMHHIQSKKQINSYESKG